MHDIACKCMNIQKLFVKVSSSVGNQTKSVNYAMCELDKEQSANCNVHTGLILDSQDFFSSKTIAPPYIRNYFPVINISNYCPAINISNYCPAISIKNYCPTIKSTSIRCVGIRNLKPLLVCKT